MEQIPAKTILSGYSADGGWFGYQYNMNLYKGCCHGCIYCDSRSECYRVEDFDRVRVKENALQTVERELRAKRRAGIVGTGSMSDPYNPYEKQLRLTQGALELLAAYGFGVGIATKSTLVTRDIPVLQRIKAYSPAMVKVTITAADDALSRTVEPHVPVSSKRFAAIRELADAGIFTGILLMPVLPFIEDTPENVLGIVDRAAGSGARFIYPAFGVTLRDTQREYFFQKLDELFPGLKQQYLDQYGRAYECRSPRSRELYRLFARRCEEKGILYRMKDIIAANRSGYEPEQLSMF